MIPAGVPDGKCGFYFSQTEVPQTEILQETTPYYEGRWDETMKSVCCWRDSEFEDDKCALHSQVADKPAEPIQKAIDDPDQRIDGVVLKSSRLINELSLSNIKLIGADLSEGNFPNCEFKMNSIQYTDFSHANLQSATFDMNHITSTNFSEGNLRDSKFCLKSGMSNITFDKSDLRHVEFENRRVNLSDFKECNFRDTDLSGLSLYRGVFSRADFTNANLFMTNLNHANVSEAIFKNVSGKSIDLWKANTNGASFLKRRFFRRKFRT